MTSVSGRRCSSLCVVVVVVVVVVMSSQYGASFSTVTLKSGFRFAAACAPRRSFVHRTRGEDDDARFAIAVATNRALVARSIES
jgi:hypothetical protein